MRLNKGWLDVNGHVEVITKTVSSVTICTKGTTVAQVNIKPPRYLQRLVTEKQNSQDVKDA